MAFVISTLMLFVAIFFIANRSKRAAIKRMALLAAAAKAVTYVSLLNDMEEKKLEGDMNFGLSDTNDKERTAEAITASVNHLFGEEPSLTHNALDLAKIHADSILWIKHKYDLRELIVQAVRVLMTTNHAGHHQLNNRRLKAIEAFDKEFPEVPNAGTFQTLIHREISKLPLKQQGNIRETFGIKSWN